MLKVNAITQQPLPNRLLRCTRAEGRGGGAALRPTCAAHAAVQMRAHLPAAHLMDVISSSVDELQPAAPGRPGGPHRFLHLSHRRFGVYARRVKGAERAGLSRKRPLPLTHSVPALHVFCLQGRVRLQPLCHRPSPLLRIVRWSAAPGCSILRVWERDPRNTHS